MTVAFFRAYQKSHPWITFSVDLSRAPHTLWLLMGEARSKCEHVAGVPLQPQNAQRLNEMYFVKGVHATAAIEGNSLSEEQIQHYLSEGELKVPPSKEYQAKEIENLVSAFNGIVKSIGKDGAPQVRPELIKDFNRQILAGLSTEDTTPGEVRHHSVGVADYRGAPAEDCEFLLSRLCDWLNDIKLDEDDDIGLGGAMLKAVLAHLYLAWIHPFGDGNGRTARLLEFYILVSAGVPVPSAHLLSDHYNQTRSEYYRHLAYASKSGGDIQPFILYALKGFVEELREQVNFIRGQLWGIAWRDFINELLDDGGPSETTARRKALVLDLTWAGAPVIRSKLLELTPRVATLYARKTDKTLSRDLNALCEMGVVERTQKGLYRARMERILAFLPERYKKQARVEGEKIRKPEPSKS
ncbi:MAG TPA: Fic family protein [Thermoanaerobaculia bacterium]|nr:Fic family protein [Thermoanaerobaculia bacterium]